MSKDIDEILSHPIKDVVRLILEQLEPYQIGSIRHQLAPRWYDGVYDKWSHTDPLFSEVFANGGVHRIDFKDPMGNWESECVPHYRCLLCSELLINAEGYTDGRYAHLFANCKVAAGLRVSSSSEQEHRLKITEHIKERGGIA